MPSCPVGVFRPFEAETGRQTEIDTKKQTNLIHVHKANHMMNKRSSTFPFVDLIDRKATNEAARFRTRVRLSRQLPTRLHRPENFLPKTAHSQQPVLPAPHSTRRYNTQSQHAAKTSLLVPRPSFPVHCQQPPSTLHSTRTSTHTDPRENKLLRFLFAAVLKRC